MVFARKVWKLLVAIKDLLALIFLLLFFLALYAALTTRPNAALLIGCGDLSRFAPENCCPRSWRRRLWTPCRCAI